MKTPVHTGRDPVCEAIESVLNALQSQGEGSFVQTEKAGSVHVAFGGIHAEAETCDIALVRLASAMMDDQRFSPALIEGLRGHVFQASVRREPSSEFST